MQIQPSRKLMVLGHPELSQVAGTVPNGCASAIP
jgi:hypothetical protein